MKAIFISAFVNPFTAILLILAIVSTFTDMIFPYFSLFSSRPENFTCATVIIIVTMIMLSGLLRFVQEYRSGNATTKLLAMIKTTCTVTRNGQEKDIDLNDVVVGDIVHLSAGNMIPADLRILENTDLFVNRSELTGESRPVEKSAADETPKDQITDYENIALMGSNVISGRGLGLVIEVGSDTMFGSMARAVAKEKVTTNFTKGVNSVSWVLIRFMMVMVPLVFLINGLTKHDCLETFLFGISTAVGLTPEMLPMIVTTCLTKGAIAMSRLDCYWNIDGQADDRVLRHAFLNSYFQTGYKNVMDKAIIAKAEDTESHPELQDLENDYVKIDEIPFDFKRRRLSIVVKDPNGKRQMVTKGAVEEMLSVCSYAETKTGIQLLNDALQKQVKATVDRLNDKGFRVLILAQKTDPAPIDVLSAKNEKDIVLMGYLAFLDPPKESTGRALKALLEHGVTTKILTGDNDKVTATVCQEVGRSVACF
ncbi:HAD-IC family P-type ATPase [Limosilactobacillus mucosae]|uniref:HAD-IC family P-type ATPase n=1 Tax=Limosilactobacillus mucosae TaxID=97478 RepID=UPI0008D789A3|nr:Mg2+-importing ATPase [Limosilactobacillus mucosae]SFK00126.1 Mg2+-importing ATPase [Limosilactobacillus mucosae]